MTNSFQPTDEDFQDAGGVIMISHLLLRDKDTGEVILSRRDVGSSERISGTDV